MPSIHLFIKCVKQSLLFTKPYIHYYTQHKTTDFDVTTKTFYPTTQPENYAQFSDLKQFNEKYH